MTLARGLALPLLHTYTTVFGPIASFPWLATRLCRFDNIPVLITYVYSINIFGCNTLAKCRTESRNKTVLPRVLNIDTEWLPCLETVCLTYFIIWSFLYKLDKRDLNPDFVTEKFPTAFVIYPLAYTYLVYIKQRCSSRSIWSACMWPLLPMCRAWDPFIAISGAQTNLAPTLPP
jgi:hypothetical protein